MENKNNKHTKSPDKKVRSVFKEQKAYIRKVLRRRPCEEGGVDLLDLHDREDGEGRHVWCANLSCGGVVPVDTFVWKLFLTKAEVFLNIYFPTQVPDSCQVQVAEFCSAASLAEASCKLCCSDSGDVYVKSGFSSKLINLNQSVGMFWEALMLRPVAFLRRCTAGVYHVLAGTDPQQAFYDCFVADDGNDGDGAFPAMDFVARDAGVASDDKFGSDNHLDGSADSREATKDKDIVGSLMPPPTEDYTLDAVNVNGRLGLSQVVTAARNFLEKVKDGKGDKSKAGEIARMNFLLSGPPGAGKTEFVKYFAHEIGEKVWMVRFSDVVDRYVGCTEKNIRKAFMVAKEAGAILFFDELDSIMASRSLAHYGWERSQCNQLLVELESFGGIVIGATNFLDCIDTAILRRFTYKLTLDYLKEEQKEALFAKYFGMVLPESEKRRLEALSLTPGDFRTVRDSTVYLGQESDLAVIISSLEEESASKGPCNSRRRIGF